MTSSTDEPDQGDPAAAVLWEVLDRDGLRWDVSTAPDVAQRQADDIGGTFVPLYRAPGAVAAAPPGEEGEVEVPYLWGLRDDRPDSEVRGHIFATHVSLLGPPEEWSRSVGCTVVALGPASGGPAITASVPAWQVTPPAGHEDEAAVERAARAAREAWAGGRPPERHPWPMLREATKDDWRNAARAALAAARGPRTPADHVVVPRAELVALYGDAPVDVPVIRRILGVTT